VLLVLADAAGQVVTRDILFQRCWGGIFVGDDSLNRVVAAVRKVAIEVAGGSFAIETVPRTGYRLRVLRGTTPRMKGGAGVASAGASRRRIMVGGAAAAAVAGVGVGGLWWAKSTPSDPQFDALMARGDEAFRNGSAFTNPKTIELYEQAVRLDPYNAKAWGLLAYFRSAQLEGAEAQDSVRRIEEAGTAIRRSLAIDPKEANALTAMFLLEGPMLDWAKRDRRLRDIIAIDPNNIPAMAELMPLLQAAGLTRESWSWNERILKLAPLSLPFLVIRAMKLWIIGNMPAADTVIDRVRGLWPKDPFAYGVRFMLLALTGRPRAALAMLDSAPDMIGVPEEVLLWRAALEALDARTPGTIDAARAACLDAAKKAPWVVYNGVMILGALGQTDAAFECTDGFLLWRGKLVGTNQADPRAINATSRRMTQWLFTPPLATMRADPRFLQLCEDFGIAAYWRARGVKPDYLIYKS
jgi:tetratricopeptide (TPR) repeat protein